MPNSFKDYKLFLSPLSLCREQGLLPWVIFTITSWGKKKIDWSSCPYALLVPFILWWDMPIKRNTKWSMSNLLGMKRWLRLGSFFRERLLDFAARLVSNFWRANDKWMLLLEYSGSASSLYRALSIVREKVFFLGLTASLKFFFVNCNCLKNWNVWKRSNSKVYNHWMVYLEYHENL